MWDAPQIKYFVSFNISKCNVGNVFYKYLYYIQISLSAFWLIGTLRHKPYYISCLTATLKTY